MDSSNPLEEVEKILSEESDKITSERAGLHAQMILLSGITQKNHVQANLLWQSSMNGPDYVANLIMQLGDATKEWISSFTSRSTIDISRILLGDDDDEDEEWDRFAHHVLKETFSLQPGADQQEEFLAKEVLAFVMEMPAEEWTHMVVHLVYLYATIVGTVLTAADDRLAAKAFGGES